MNGGQVTAGESVHSRTSLGRSSTDAVGLAGSLQALVIQQYAHPLSVSRVERNACKLALKTNLQNAAIVRQHRHPMYR